MNQLVNRCVVVTLLLLASVLSPATARASAQDKAVAESLYRDALTQMRLGNFSSACPMLAESQRLDPAVGTLLYLGECYEQLGLTASAWVTFVAASDAARHVRNLEREQIALERAKLLKERVAHLTLVVPADIRVDGLEVKQDGRIIGQAAWGAALPVDPGPHTLEATAPGRQAWLKHLTIDAAPHVDVTETIPVLPLVASAAEPEPLEPRRPDTAPDAARKPLVMESAPLADTEERSRSRSSRIRRGAAWALGGLGVVAIGVGTGFGIRAKSKVSASEAYCYRDDSSRCSHRGVELVDQAKTAAAVANVGFLVGASALVGACVLYFTAQAPPPPAAKSNAVRLKIVPEFMPTQGHITLQGSF